MKISKEHCLSRLSVTLFFLSAALLAAGFAITDIRSAWVPKRAIEMLFMALMVGTPCAMLAWWRRWPPYNLLLMVWGILALLHLGLVVVLTFGLLSAAAVGLGAFLTNGLGRCRWALSWLIGLLMIGGTLGWLLPWPVHYRSVYLVILIAVVLCRFRVLLRALRDTRAAWRLATRRTPYMAFAALVVAGLASIMLWLPTLQFDDAVYHLGLPTQLLNGHYYRFDVLSQAWALAPWMGDTLYAVVMVIAGADGRGAMNGAWLVLLLYFVWALARALQLAHRERWLAVMLVASQPGLFALLGGMQVELPLAVCLAAAVVLILREKRGEQRVGMASSGLIPLMLVTAGLLAFKASSVVWVASLVVWALWGRNLRHDLKTLGVGFLLCAAWAGSSYAYAWGLAGNPVLPLFNDIFQSPYFPPIRLTDMRWFDGIHLTLPWDLVFKTDRFVEGYPGAIGFSVLMLVAGGGMAMAASATARALLFFLLVAFFAMFLNIQYVRYVFPVLTLFIPLAVAGYTTFLSQKVITAGLMALAALNLAFYPNGWYGYRSNMLWPVFMFKKTSGSIHQEFLPEQFFADYLRMNGDKDHSVLLVDQARPHRGLFAGHAITWEMYGFVLTPEIKTASEDLSGSTWAQILKTQGLTHVLLPEKEANPALMEALTQLSAVPVYQAHEMALWSLPPEQRTYPPLFTRRDEARKRLWWLLPVHPEF
ncbi:MAG: hypothetical protein LBI16_03560 [Burkholderiales bacterium]|nr:hypothetical protein [Burkholderiales bacterium]